MKSRSAVCGLFFAIATQNVCGFVSYYSHPGLLLMLRSPVSSQHPGSSVQLFAVNDDSADNAVDKNDDNTNEETSSVESEKDEEQQQPLMQTSTVKIDDGGSDLTDRFKYKVQALMGNFDPAETNLLIKYRHCHQFRLAC